MLACASESSARSLQGTLRFRAARDVAGVTRVVDANRSAPLQLQRPLYLDPERAGLATVHIVNATAGLFAGDELFLRVDVLPGASLELRTPAMTCVYKMEDADCATTAMELSVGADAYVECIPAPVILYASAALRQQTRVDLAERAHAAVGEVWAFGRAAHRELHAYRELEARTEIHWGGALILAEALDMRPADGLADAAVAGYAAFGSLALVGPRVGDACLGRIRESLAAHPGILGGASMLAGASGISVRALGASAHAVDAMLRAIVGDFRQQYATVQFDSAKTSLCAAPGGGVL